MATLETLERIVHASTRDRIIRSIFIKCRSPTIYIKEISPKEMISLNKDTSLLSLNNTQRNLMIEKLRK